MTGLTTGLLTFQQAANEVGLPTLAIYRLVARGTIQGRAIGMNGKRLIHAEDLAQWVAAGASDADMPPTRQGWITLGDGDTIRRRVAAIMTDEAPATPPADRRINVRPSAAVLAIVNDSPGSVVRIKGKAAPSDRYATNLQAYAAGQLLDVLQTPATRAGKGKGSLAGLYADQSTYDTLVSNAIDSVLAGSITSRRTYPGGITGDLVLRHSDLLTAQAMRRVAAITL